MAVTELYYRKSLCINHQFTKIQLENKSGALVQVFYRIFLQINVLAGLEDDVIFPGSFDPLEVSCPPVGQSSQYQGWDGEGSEEEGEDGEDEGAQQQDNH